MLNKLDGRNNLIPILKVFHYPEYKAWTQLMDRKHPNASTSINQRLNEEIDKREVHYSSWIPGSDWYGTEYWPIYLTMNGDKDLARKFFGNIFMNCFIHRTDHWIYRKGERGNSNREPGSHYYKIPLNG